MYEMLVGWLVFSEASCYDLHRVWLGHGQQIPRHAFCAYGDWSHDHPVYRGLRHCIAALRLDHIRPISALV